VSPTITRIANSCALLDFDGDVVLTDPYFTERWHLHRGEPLGMTIDELPALAAIVVSHFFPNHWDTRGLSWYRGRRDTPVFVASERMVRSAARIGFERVVLAEWGTTHRITDRLRLEVVEAHHSPGGNVNNYVLTSGTASVFFGGEARDVAPLRAYRAHHHPVDVALLPVNGLHVPLTGPKLVMGSHDALAGARVLGARSFVPIHDAHGHDLVWGFLQRDGSAQTARDDARPGDPDVVCLATGVPWSG